MKYLRNNEIDRHLWDSCVKHSSCNLIYAQSFYLDAMAENWDAIVVGNYEAVFPLPWKSKFGIKYIYRPAFTQQLGLFSTRNDVALRDLLDQVKKHFKYADLCLNYRSDKADTLTGHTNYVLSLNRPYEAIAGNYKTDLKKNLKKTEKENWNYNDNLFIKRSIEMFREQYGDRFFVSDKDYISFENLCIKPAAEKKVFTRSVTDAYKNTLAVGLFLFHGDRMYNMMNTTTEAGRMKEANHYLLDKVIQEFAGTDIVFDFEGSDIEGVQKFYENFRPVNQPYFSYRYNNLPALIKLIKK